MPEIEELALLGVVSPRRSRRRSPCAADDPNRWRSRRRTSSPSGDSPAATPPPGSRSAGRGSSWPSPTVAGCRRSPPSTSAMRPRSGAPAGDTAAWASMDCSRRRRGPLPAAWLLDGTGGVHRACPGLGSGVQPARRAPVRVDLDQSKDEGMVRETRDLNFGHYLRAATLEQKERLVTPLLPHIEGRSEVGLR